MLKKIKILAMVLGLGALAFYFFLPVNEAQAHGSMADPVSRIYDCYLQNPETPDTLACVEAIWAGGTQPIYDWNEVNQPNAGGNHQAVVPDGMLCSGGREKYAFFDSPRTDWATTILPDNGQYTFLYEAYVPHNQGYFELYVSKDEYDYSEPLKWSDLEYPPFATVVEPPVVGGAYVMTVDVPPGKSGRHVIYVIWQRNDSQEAFYSCSDVWFGNDPMPEPTTPPACVYPEWESNVIYSEGDYVTYNGASWKAKWGTGGTTPSTDGGTNPWEFNGDCSAGGPVPTETPTAVPGLLGDVNSDGMVDIVDGLLISQYYVGYSLDNFDETQADVNCSGAIDIVDALLVAQYYVGSVNLGC